MTFRVARPSIAAVMLIFPGVFFVFPVIFYVVGERGAALGFLVVGLLFIFMWVKDYIVKRLVVDATGVELITLTTRRKMAWGEIKVICFGYYRRQDGTVRYVCIDGENDYPRTLIDFTHNSDKIFIAQHRKALEDEINKHWPRGIVWRV